MNNATVTFMGKEIGFADNIEFEPIPPRNRELELKNYTDMVATIVCSVFGIEKTELFKRYKKIKGASDSEHSKKCRELKRKLRKAMRRK